MDIIRVPKVLLPKKNVDYSKWAVVACDQFTSQEEYWAELYKSCGEVSSLHLVLPEIYLTDKRVERLESIRKNMQKYIKDDIFDVYTDDLIMCERTNNQGLVRAGLMIAVDLEAYDYKPMNTNYIKATEATVKERLPVRVEIRNNAIIELPHIMLLMDNDECDIIEPLYANRDNYEKLYDFECNMNGGHLRGYRVGGASEIINKLYNLINKDRLRQKYNSDNPFLFAVGDGNHSLAAAKQSWEAIKDTVPSEQLANHPKRFALVELVNLHCEGLLFEPIHRVVMKGGSAFISAMLDKFVGDNRLLVTYNGDEYSIPCSSDPTVAIKDTQEFIDEYALTHDIEIDYIHGEQHLADVALHNNGIAIYLPKILKSSLFKYVINNGILPRKAFSMGEAEDKRYYLEARVIDESN